VRVSHSQKITALLAVLLTAPSALFAQTAATPPPDIVIKNATVMTASHGTIEHGSVWVHEGKIAGPLASS
jgi:adenine deaminase